MKHRCACEPLETRRLLADWQTLNVGVGPVRGIERIADGRLVGVRSGGNSVVLVQSSDAGNRGRSWQNGPTIVADAGISYGDPILARAADNTLFCAYRQQSAGQFRVSVSRSTDNGATWRFDSDVTPWSNTFVGAPFLSQRASGDLQVYYDSEPAAAAGGDAGDQWIAMKQRVGQAGSWDANGTVIAARSAAISELSRDGMPSVISLGAFGNSERLMCVVEGVRQGRGQTWNVVRAYQSFDAGRTWNYASRQVVYESPRVGSAGGRFNAYNPFGIRVGNGPVRVAFCTDEDKPGEPDASSLEVGRRFARVKFVQTTVNFETWSPTPSDLYVQGDSTNYNPGLFEVAPNQVLCTIDQLDGSVRTLRDPPLDVIAPSLVAASLTFAALPEVRFTFDEALDPANVTIGDLQITNLTTNRIAVASQVRLSGDGRTVTFALSPTLADGNYRFRVFAGAVSDPSGNATTSTAELSDASAFLLAGDANRDRAVNFDDLLVLARAYGQRDVSLLGGNFDGSSDGLVNFDDLLLLARRYGQTLAPRAASFAAPDVPADPSRRVASRRATA